MKIFLQDIRMQMKLPSIRQERSDLLCGGFKFDKKKKITVKFYSCADNVNNFDGLKPYEKNV